MRHSPERPGESAPKEGQRRLKAGTVGTVSLVFLTLAATAPLTSMASNLALSLGAGVGAGTVLVVAAVGVLMAFFAVAFVAVTRKFTHTAASYAVVTYGLGPATGSATAMIVAIAYNVGSGAMICGSGFFLSQGLDLAASVSLPWWACSAVIWIIVGVLGYSGIREAKKVAAVVACLELGLFLLIAFAVLWQNPGGFAAPEAFTPLDAPMESLVVSLVFIVLCFGGFEASAVYGEETRGRRDVGRAAYISVATLSAVYMFGAWCLVAAFDDVQAIAGRDPGSLIPRLAHAYIGSWVVPVFGVMTALSFTAAAIVFQQNATRYLFGLSREGLLPAAWSRVNEKRGVPHTAVTVQLMVSALIVAVPALLRADLLRSVFPALSGITSLAMTGAFSIGCLSVIRAARRGGLDDSSWFAVQGAPAIAFVGFGTVTVAIFLNYSALVNSDSLLIKLMPGVLLLAAAYGIWASRRAPSPTVQEGLTEEHAVSA